MSLLPNVFRWCIQANVYGAIQVLRNAMECGGVSFLGKKRYEDVRFNLNSITRG